MAIELLSAEDIAERRLLAALRMWNAEDYISAITLAGAAEEILGKRLRKADREPSFDNLRDVIVRLNRRSGDEDPKTEQRVAELLNSTKNALKHYAEDDPIEIDPREHAIEMLERATYNYMLQTGDALAEMPTFWQGLDDT